MQIDSADLSEPAALSPLKDALILDLSVPLIVDLDGTLLSTDTLHESLLCFVRKHTGEAWKVFGWISAGPATLKQQLAAALSKEEVEHLPTVVPLIELIEREARLGRKIVLATAADDSIARMVAERFGYFSEVLASDGKVNFKGHAKAAALTARFPNGFIYAGDSSADLRVWKAATAAVVVGHASLAKKASRVTKVVAEIRPASLNFWVLRKALRLHQWAKNALIFVPFILGGKFFDLQSWVHATLAFVAFGLLASATYLFNDLWDLVEDRQHWSKRARPLASGRLPITSGVLFLGLCGFGSLALGAALGPSALAVLAVYLAMSLAYSFRLKREPIIDVLMLAAMFSLRLALGMAVTSAAFSPWLMVFSMFVFLSLSLAKRQTEITRMITHGRKQTLGRGYHAEDGPLVLGLGLGSTMAAVLIMVLYLIEDAFPAGFYQHPSFLWGFPIVIFLFLSRIWLLCHRGELHDDPVAFALKDRVSLVYGATMTALFIIGVV